MCSVADVSCDKQQHAAASAYPLLPKAVWRATEVQHDWQFLPGSSGLSNQIRLVDAGALWTCLYARRARRLWPDAGACFAAPVAALVGSVTGLAAGVLVTPLLGRALGALLPVTPGFVLDAGALAKAAAYGMLVALVFAAPPLARARAFPAMALMRADCVIRNF